MDGVGSDFLSEKEPNRCYCVPVETCVGMRTELWRTKKYCMGLHTGPFVGYNSKVSGVCGSRTCSQQAFWKGLVGPAFCYEGSNMALDELRSVGLIAAERRRQIYQRVMQSGSVNVSELAALLGVRAKTIRKDLDVLQSEGKLIRSHGGAVSNDSHRVIQPYSEIRKGHMEEKGWIARAALDYLPPTGSVFIDGGSTSYEFALMMPEELNIHVVTISPLVAAHLAERTTAVVDLLGGRVRKESTSTDGTLSEEALDMLYFDVAFVVPTGVDVKRGVSTIDRMGIRCERKMVEHADKVVCMFDSSKVNKFWYTKLGPISMVDVIITDSGIDLGVAEQFRALDIEVVIAGPDSILDDRNNGGNDHN